MEAKNFAKSTVRSIDHYKLTKHRNNYYFDKEQKACLFYGITSGGRWLKPNGIITTL